MMFGSLSTANILVLQLTIDKMAFVCDQVSDKSVDFLGL